MEIAKLEAATVKRGGANNPEGLGGKSGKKSVHKIVNRGINTVDNDRNDRNQQTGLLRRLAKQGRDDLLERVASGELSKAFTATELVAIEEEIGNRQGKRTDLELPVDRPEVTGNETRAIAAEKAGFGSEVTYRRAKAVVRDGVPELQEAMDDGSLTINAGTSGRLPGSGRQRNPTVFSPVFRPF